MKISTPFYGFVLLLPAWLSATPVTAQTPPPTGGLAASMQPFIDRGTMAGAVLLVASRDKVLDVETVGYADREAKKPMAPDTVFWIASMTKAMTCSALMMLVDEGKVNVDDPVEKYLPEFKGQMIAEKNGDQVVMKQPNPLMTVRNLMSHTAGLPEKTPADAPTFDMTPLSVRVPNYAATPLETQPGTKFRYTNVGMTTVGRIVEVVSGMPYEQFMQQRLFQPLGMTDTTFHPNAAQLQRLAKTYKSNVAKNGLELCASIGMLNRDLTDPKRIAWPGGGLFSTADDIAKFCQMVLNGGVAADGKRILSEASIAAATRKETGDAVKDGYGFGWFMFPGGFFHAGADGTEMRLYTKLGLISVFMVQQANEWPNGDQKNLRSAFADAAVKYAPGPAATAPSH